MKHPKRGLYDYDVESPEIVASEEVSLEDIGWLNYDGEKWFSPYGEVKDCSGSSFGLDKIRLRGYQTAMALRKRNIRRFIVCAFALEGIEDPEEFVKRAREAGVL